LAAAALGVPADTLEVEDGLVQSRATNRSVTYQELLDGRPFGIDVDPAAPVKAPAEYRRIGQPAVPRGIAAIVTGKPHFVHDMRLPGLLHARVVRPPHYGATLA